MAFTGDQKKAYDQKRYRLRRSQREGGDESRKLFPVRLKHSILGWVRRIQAEAINSGKYPWTGTSELFEALLQRGLLSLRNDELIDEIAPYIRLSQQFDAIHAVRRQAQVALSRASTEISALLTIGDRESAAQYFHSSRKQMLQLAPTTWRDWLLRELDKAFPELLKMSPKGVRLLTVDDADDVHSRNGHAGHGSHAGRHDERRTRTRTRPPR